MDNCDGVKMRHLTSHDWCLFPQNQFQHFKVESLVALIIKKKSGTISTMKILNEQNLILNRQIQDFWVCSTKGVGESMVGYWLLFFLVWGYKKDSLKGSLINFQDFQLQSSI